MDINELKDFFLEDQDINQTRTDGSHSDKKTAGDQGSYLVFLRHIYMNKQSLYGFNATEKAEKRV